MNKEFKANIGNQNSWKRGLYMLLFIVCYGLANWVLLVVVAFQFIHKLITGVTNPRLHKLGQSLATYAYQIIQFESFNSEYHPYPLGAWPKGEPAGRKVVPEKPASDAD